MEAGCLGLQQRSKRQSRQACLAHWSCYFTSRRSAGRSFPRVARRSFSKTGNCFLNPDSCLSSPIMASRNHPGFPAEDCPKTFVLFVRAHAAPNGTSRVRNPRQVARRASGIENVGYHQVCRFLSLRFEGVRDVRACCSSNPTLASHHKLSTRSIVTACEAVYGRLAKENSSVTATGPFSWPLFRQN